MTLCLSVVVSLNRGLGRSTHSIPASLRLALHHRLGDQESISHRLHQLLQLSEDRLNAEWTGPPATKESLARSTITRNWCSGLFGSSICRLYSTRKVED